MQDFLGEIAIVLGYFWLGIDVVRQCEGWSGADALYFWLMTVSTVGYGDLAPTTPAGKTFVAIYAPVGIVLVFGVVARRMTYVQEAIQALQAKALALVGIEVVDVEALSIPENSPDAVNARVSYWRRYLLAAAPLCALIAAFIVAVAYSLDGLSPAAMFVDGQPPKTWDAVKAGLPSASSLLEAFYFGTVTATTIGYGDHHLLALEPGVKVAAALYVVLVVVVFANCVSDILLIRSRQRLRHGSIALPTLDDLEELLKEKLAKRGHRARDLDLSEAGIDEADYVIATLRKGGLVDPQILLTIRRAFYWAARADGVGTRITESDLVALRFAADLAAENGGSRHEKDE